MESLSLLSLVSRGKISLTKIITILLFIREEGPIGRYRLCRELRISEGILRGLLVRLAKSGLIVPLRAGSILTPNGDKLLKSILNDLGIVSIKKINLEELSKSPINIVIQIRGIAINELGSCLEERDIAVRYGAKGAIIITKEDYKLKIPSVYENLTEVYPRISYILETAFNINEGDVLAVVFDHNEWILREAALAVALKLKGYLCM